MRDACGKQKGYLTVEDVSGIRELIVRDSSIKDLSGIENMTQLLVLALGNSYNWGGQFVTPNQISDISPLAELSQLTDLHLNSNQISDISSLANLAQLIRLYLRDNPIRDYGALSLFEKLLFLETNTLSPGDSDEAVKSIQKQLIELGYLSGSMDGKFGPATAEAVRKAQKAVGYEQSGEISGSFLLWLYSPVMPRAN